MAAEPEEGSENPRGNDDPVLVVVGPTATGKSRLAVEICQLVDGEIINADALQAYRGLDIGTAKPESELLAAVPHHLIDILEPTEVYSAGEFARRARRSIADIRQRGRRPVVVGGSGFYVRALLFGLSPIPEPDPDCRQELLERLGREGLESLWLELQEVDPATASRLHQADRQRILRALEVARSSGQPLSEWRRLRPLEEPLEALTIGLTLPRSILYDRIDSRIREMIAEGWVGEVTGLLARGIDPAAAAFQAIGYRQMVRHVLGEWSLEEAIADTSTATRRYAKRQLTWFRKEAGIRWLPTSAEVDLSLLHQLGVVEEEAE
nr:tRNA dimethylallyltransferase-like [Nerophis lumbriciformis]